MTWRTGGSGGAEDAHFLGDLRASARTWQSLSLRQRSLAVRTIGATLTKIRDTDNDVDGLLETS